MNKCLRHRPSKPSTVQYETSRLVAGLQIIAATPLAWHEPRHKKNKIKFARELGYSRTKYTNIAVVQYCIRYII